MSITVELCKLWLFTDNSVLDRSKGTFGEQSLRNFIFQVRSYSAPSFSLETDCRSSWSTRQQRVAHPQEQDDFGWYRSNGHL